MAKKIKEGKKTQLQGSLPHAGAFTEVTAPRGGQDAPAFGGGAPPSGQG